MTCERGFSLLEVVAAMALLSLAAIGLLPAFIDGLSKPFNLAGIEIYRSPAEIPAQYGGPQSRCGVIVMWNRRGGVSMG